ncbi:AbrB family transcriptional regulator [Candidatus Clostridium radicumherbarum]|uniref:AbrB family transcriptional regulator n=1 Tax=Candidatus Clostridium radicumherbarum TaxID=3381662 RepID=A0ABW8TTI8_9CLOT
MINLIITLIIGLIGGLTALRLKVPAGAMVGAMLSVAIFNVITGSAYLPQDVRIITQIAAGAFIGSGIKYKDVLDLKKMLKPAILMVTTMIVLDLLMGLIMYKITGINLVTALFACAPGGIVDMSLISNDLGADSSKVAILQMVRLMCVFIIFPPSLKFLSSRINKSEKSDENPDLIICSNSVDASMQAAAATKEKSSSKEKVSNLILTLTVALAAGLIGYKLKIPAGALTFSMLSVGAFSVIFNRGYMPLNLRRLTQVFAGILIGERMTYGNIVELKGIILPALILLVGIILVNLCIGIFITKVCGLELITSLLASAPGGVSDMALIAKDLGGDAPKVAILQLARYVCVIATFPFLVKFISSL